VTQHFPTWVSNTFFETWALTCLFHDIGTTTNNRSATHLSFEFQGGFIALTKVQEFGAPQAQAESVAEAIIRHQDPGESGMVSRMVQLVQIATEFDNMGWQPHLVSKEVIKQVVQQHPRMGWSGCFSRTINEEIAEKPWCHTTALEGFAEAVAGNEVMKLYE
jgi:cyanamide hydratase